MGGRRTRGAPQPSACLWQGRTSCPSTGPGIIIIIIIIIITTASFSTEILHVLASALAEIRSQRVESPQGDRPKKQTLEDPREENPGLESGGTISTGQAPHQTWLPTCICAWPGAWLTSCMLARLNVCLHSYTYVMTSWSYHVPKTCDVLGVMKYGIVWLY